MIGWALANRFLQLSGEDHTMMQCSPMLRRVCVVGSMLALLGSAMLGFVPRVEAARKVTADTLTDDDVTGAIKGAMDHIFDSLAKMPTTIDKGGVAPATDPFLIDGAHVIMIYSLLQAAKAKVNDQRLGLQGTDFAEHCKWLAEFDVDKHQRQTYIAGLQASALALLPQEGESPYRKALKRVAAQLAQGANPKVNAYHYPLWGLESKDTKDGYDNSCTQYGLLGVWAAADVGLEVKTDYWIKADGHWRKDQRPDGGWAYDNNPKSATTGTMTAAGVASMYVCHDFLDVDAPLVAPRDPVLEKGLAALIKPFTGKPANPFADGGGALLYYMYGIERVGLASGLKYFDKVNWYKEGAALLVNSQQNGAWNYSGNDVGTAYGLLFLVRGRNPIIFSKLQYNGPWNARGRDDANLTARLAAKGFERAMNWQVVGLDHDPADWFDAPLLLITGSQDPNFTPQDVAKLKEFVEMGGIIFSTADGGKSAFTDAVRKYAKQICSGKYEVRELSRDHAIFNVSKPIPSPPRIMGWSNGIREFWIHVPDNDFGKSWQTHEYAKNDAFDVPRNAFVYASGKGNTRNKLQSLVVPASTAVAAHAVTVARVKYAGNYNPEPGAWGRFGKIAKATFSTDIQLVETPIGALDPKKARVAHMTGTAAFTIPDADIVKLRAYLDAGGTLFGDSGGGKPEFTTSFLKLATALYPDSSPETIPVTADMYSGNIANSVKITEVAFRRFWVDQQGHAKQPRLLGVKQNNRYVVIYSPDDICSGFLGTETWGILGYTPASAQDLARDVILYAANGPLAVAAAPATATAPAASAPAAGATTDPAPAATSQPSAP